MLHSHKQKVIRCFYNYVFNVTEKNSHIRIVFLFSFIFEMRNLPGILKEKLRLMFARWHSSANLHVFPRNLFSNLLQLMWDEESKHTSLQHQNICRPPNVCVMQMFTDTTLLTLFTFGRILVVTTEFARFGAAIYFFFVINYMSTFFSVFLK